MISSRSPLALLTPEQKVRLARSYQTFSKEERAAFDYSWPFWARPEQLPPEGNWRIWMILAGRGWGKTRTISEFCRAQIEAGHSRGGLIARTSADARDVMIEGESGLLSICPPWNRPTYEPSKRRVTWPNGAMVTLYTAEESDALRGPQHSFLAMDELATWPSRDAFDQAMFGLRLGTNPRTVIATTPRPTPLIKELVARPDVAVTRGSTWDNSANLPEGFLQQLRDTYEGTRLGRQEIDAEILLDTPGALWRHEWINAGRVKQAPELKRVIVAVDPAVTSHEGSDETGLVVAGVDAADHLYILQDASMRGSPHEWCSKAITLYRQWRADRIIAEVNQGGDLVEGTLRAIDRNVAFEAVRATRGKYTRAEPVSALYEQGRAHHVGKFPELEEQLCGFVPDMKKSPDRADALVWAGTFLCVKDLSCQLFLPDEHGRLRPAW
jgi:phage terminase large subunit-like protein